MKGRILLIVLMMLAVYLPGSAGTEAAGETLYVKKVENLPEDFIFGMDV